MNSFREKVLGFIQTVKRSKKLSLFAILFLVAAIPTTVYLSQQLTETRQQANTNQARITVDPATINAGGTVNVTWTLGNNAICTMYTVTHDGTAFHLHPPANTKFQRVQITKVTNAQYEIFPYTNGSYSGPILTKYTTPFTYDVPTTATSVGIHLIPSDTNPTSGIEFTVTDSCGTHQDTITNQRANQQSFNFIPKAYAQTTLTGAETLQLFTKGYDDVRLPTPEKIGEKMYLNCQPVYTHPGSDALNPPPSSPIASGQCPYTMPNSTRPSIYFFRMLAADGTTVLGESPLITVLNNPNGLISYWSMDQDKEENVYDDLQKNNGFAYADSVVDGKIGKGHTFGAHPKQFITLPSKDSLTPPQFTVSAWVYPPSEASFGLGNNASIFNERNTSDIGGIALDLNGNDGGDPLWANGQINCKMYIKGAEGPSGWAVLVPGSSSKKLTPAQWNHVSCSFDGKNIKLYLNGELIESQKAAALLKKEGEVSVVFPPDVQIAIGKNLKTNQLFKGIIDEVGFWNKALTDVEIQKLASGERPNLTLINPPIPSINPTFISLSTKFPGIGTTASNANPKHTTRPATVSFFNKDNKLVGTKNGAFTYNQKTGEFDQVFAISNLCPPNTPCAQPPIVIPPPIGDPRATLTMTFPAVQKGTPTQVQFGYGPPPGPNDLFSVYREENLPQPGDIYKRAPVLFVPDDEVKARVINFYASTCLATPNGQARPTGACNIATTDLAPGRYSVRLFANNGFTDRLAITEFIVLDPTLPTPPPLSGCTTDADCPVTADFPATRYKCFKEPNSNYPGTCRPADTVCAQVITRACKMDQVLCVVGPCPPREVCVEFPTPCDVPPGWTVRETTEITQETSISSEKPSSSLMQFSEGVYTVKISTPQFLTKQLPGIVTLKQNQTVTLPTVTLVTGDVNGDNVLNILDYNLIAACYGDKLGSDNCKASPHFDDSFGPLADLNDDGIVDGIDYNLFIKSLGTQKGD